MNRQVQFGRPAPMISKKHAPPEKNHGKWTSHFLPSPNGTNSAQAPQGSQF